MPDQVSEVNVTALKQLIDSSGWKEFKKHTAAMIEDLRDLLESGTDEDERHRGRIDAIRMLIEWPESTVELSELENEN